MNLLQLIFKLFRIGGMSVCLFLLMHSSFATSFVSIPLPQQVAEGTNVVRGKIGLSYSDWGVRADGTRGIYTFYQLQTTEVFKGDVQSPATILIREMGGQKDGVAMQVAGSAEFGPGEDVVVFLAAKNPDQSYDLFGLSSAKYTIDHQSDGKEYLVGLNSSAPQPGRREITSSTQNETIASLRKIAHEDLALPHPKKVIPSTPPRPSDSSEAHAESLAGQTPVEAGEKSNSTIFVMMGLLISLAAFFIIKRKKR